jgi:hypothetical protein
LDYTKENARGLPVSDSSRACGDVSAKSHASLQDNRFSNGILGNTAQSVFSAIFKDQPNRFSEILATLFGRAALTVGARNLRTVSDEPVFVFFYDCREFIVHNSPPLYVPSLVLVADKVPNGDSSAFDYRFAPRNAIDLHDVWIGSAREFIIRRHQEVTALKNSIQC